MTAPTPPAQRSVTLLGAGGFLGRHLAAHLSAEGWHVKGMQGRDLTELSQAQWDDLISGSGALINAAGRTTGDLEDLTRANVLLLAQAIEAAQRAGIRLVHLASAAEYGPVPGGHAAQESDPVKPVSPYGATKLAGTLLLDEAARAGRVDAVALRLTNPLGAGMSQSSLPGRAAQQFSQAAQTGLSEIQFGPLGAQRDFTDARDVARAVAHTLPGAAGAFLSGVVNMGSGQATPVRDLVTQLARLSGFTGQVRESAPGSPRSSDVAYQRADIQLLIRSGFKPHYTLTQSLEALLTGLSPSLQHTQEHV